jgi:hypothetical protein
MKTNNHLSMTGNFRISWTDNTFRFYYKTKTAKLDTCRLIKHRDLKEREWGEGVGEGEGG